MNQKIENLRAEIRRLEEEDRQAASARRATVKVEWEYFIEPAVVPTFDRIYDDSVRLYRIFGIILNKAEAEAVGHNVDGDHQGMVYLYNSLSERIVMSTGGGHVIVSDRAFSSSGKDPVYVEASARNCLNRIARVIATCDVNPSLNITEIVKDHHREIGREH